MIKTFEKDDAFTTFGSERDRSVSSNCHVLLALVEWDDPRYAPQMLKAAVFICESWWNHVGVFKDKWASHDLQKAYSLFADLLVALESFLPYHAHGRSLHGFNASFGQGLRNRHIS